MYVDSLLCNTTFRPRCGRLMTQTRRSITSGPRTCHRTRGSGLHLATAEVVSHQNSADGADRSTSPLFDSQGLRHSSHECWVRSGWQTCHSGCCSTMSYLQLPTQSKYYYYYYDHSLTLNPGHCSAQALYPTTCLQASITQSSVHEPRLTNLAWFLLH